MRAPNIAPRRDAYVEDVDYIYVDSGCEVAPKCLQCPLPVCKYDLGERGVPYSKVMRRMERERKAAILLNDGLKVDEIAKQLGVSRRTVFRLIQGNDGAA